MLITHEVLVVARSRVVGYRPSARRAGAGGILAKQTILKGQTQSKKLVTYLGELGVGGPCLCSA